MCAAADYFTHLPAFRVAICKRCRYAVWPDQATRHLRERHGGLSAADRAAIVSELNTWPRLSLSTEPFVLPAIVPQPIPELRLYNDGLLCQLPPGECTFVARCEQTLKKHWRSVHQWRVDRRGGAYGLCRKQTAAQRQADACKAVRCQRFFHHGQYASYFEVASTISTTPIVSDRSQSSSLSDMVLQELAVLTEQERQVSQVLKVASSANEVSPWLELTRWPDYLRGQHLPTTAALIRPPDEELEPILLALCSSLARAVEKAYHSICADKINVFDQVRINSFLQRPSAADRPLMVKLKKATWRKYVGIWKALLSFAYRTSQPSEQLPLRHQLTPRQVIRLSDATTHATELIQIQRSNPCQYDCATATIERVSSALDSACLDFCISILDHDLKGDLFESVVVGFFAVLGIDVEKGVLREPSHYTPSLSGFVKVAQMLVIQSAVEGSEQGLVVHPADLLDEMRARFLVHGTRSPFSWASRLRVFGTKVRDSTTCLGYISWSDDGQSVTYKGVSNLTIDIFRKFVRDEVTMAQNQLEELFLLHPQERREDLGIEFLMHRVLDNASENRKGWNFLQHEQNLASTLPNREQWLLMRVLENQWLQEEFFLASKGSNCPKWSLKAVEAYKARVDAFLERLLLLVHLTSGQPARGTELLSLRHVNTVHGHHRNIFIDNGLVSTVTTYHKGYSVTGSTKIIHRFLPKEVGELLVYYLWIVLPFCRNLELLACRNPAQPSPFIWANRRSVDSWDSSRLSRVLQREFQAAIGVPINIPVYRHLVIAISRKHLDCGGFRRDYGLEDTKFDTQSGHTS